MFTVVMEGESHLVSAEQFRQLLDVVVRLLGDASRGSSLTFTVGGLHASAPTIDWAPQAGPGTHDIDEEFARIADRLEQGAAVLESDDHLPEWMSEETARRLYNAAKRFGESPVDALRLGREGHMRRMTRQTFRTLDRLLHESTESLGSIEGRLVTATLNNGAHVSVEDPQHGQTVRCYVAADGLAAAGALLGRPVLVTGLLRRDHLGRPQRMIQATVAALPERRSVTVAAMAGRFSGPDSVEWLRAQRGG